MGGKVLMDIPVIAEYHRGKREGFAEGEAAGEARGAEERRELKLEIEKLRRENERLKAAQTVL